MALSQRLLDGIEHSIQESLDGPDGPDQDHDFPHRLVFSRVVQEPEFAFGLWDSANELSLNWQRQATTYLALASVTLFAIALYLFGQSLSMGRTRAAFILFSCGLVLLGIISSTVVACESVTPESGPTPQQCHDEHTSGNDLATEAARHYSRGRALMETYQEDGNKLRDAVREFNCAVALRPTFAFANYYLSLATSFQGTPQLSEGGFVSITSKNSLPNIADHEQKALAVLNQQRFAISPAIQSNLGFDTLLLGLARPDSKALDHSVTAAQLAVALSDTDPVLNFNLAAALLAHRQLSQALLSYKKATNLVGCGQADLIGDAITDLHVVLRYCRGVIPEPYCRQLEAEAPKLKAALAAAAWPPGVWLQRLKYFEP